MQFSKRHQWANAVIDAEGWPTEYSSEDERLLNARAIKGLLGSDASPLIKLLESKSKLPLMARVLLIDLLEGNGPTGENLVFQKCNSLKGNKKSEAQQLQALQTKNEIALFALEKGAHEEGQFEAAIELTMLKFKIGRTKAISAYKWKRDILENARLWELYTQDD